MVDYSALKTEQVKVIKHGKGNMLVSASAGSGKTFVMIQRLIRLIKDGEADVDRILAVTFTDAAAKSMKDKLKAALIEEYNISQNKRLEEQISLIDTADISTYHSFCKRLIQNYFYTVNVSPDFNVAPVEEATALKKMAMDRVFDRFYNENEKFPALVERYALSRKDQGLKNILFYMYDKCITEADFDSLLQKTLASYSKNSEDIYEKRESDNLKNLKTSLNNIKDKLNAFILGDKTDVLPDMEKNAREVISYIEELLLLSKREDIENYDKKIPSTRFTKLSQEQRIKNEELKDIRASVKKALTKFFENYEDKAEYLNSVEKVKESSELLFSVLKEFKKEYDAIKKEENVLDFDDLMSFGLKVLDDEETLSEIKSKYQYIFVDEYQDTNGIQEAIITRIAADNLFMVGDLKQSIYGFRNCRPEFFIHKYYGMKDAGESVENLNYNFRSAQKILDITNKVFLNCMTEETCGIDYREHKLISGGLYPIEYSGRVKAYRIIDEKVSDSEKEEKKERPRIYDVLTEKGKETFSAEALLIAKIINEELGSKYYDIETKTEKNVTFKDIAILLRATANEKSNAIIKTLFDMGFDIESDSEQDVLQYEEICLMKSALEIIERFYRDVPLITVMKSPIGKFSLEELAEISEFSENVDNSQYKKRLDFSEAFKYALENMTGTLGDKIRKFYGYFEKITFISAFCSAAEVMERLVFDNDLEAHFYAIGSGALKSARLRRFIAASKEHGNLSVKEFLKFINDNPSAVRINVSSGENAIKVVTVHKSKGLEYPVVIVSGLERKFNTEDIKNPVLYDSEYGFAEKVFDTEKKTVKQTALREVIKERIKRNISEEEMRIFYVALTRAKYSMHLIISGKTKKAEGTEFNSFSQYLPDNVDIEEIHAKDFEFIGKREKIRKILIGEENKTFTENMRKNLGYVYPFLQDVKLPIKTSVTDAVKIKKDDEDEQPVYRISAEKLDVTDTEKGIIAHKIMELADFYSEKSIKEQTEEFIKKGYIKEGDVKKVKIENLQKATDIPVIKDAKGKSLYKEQDFIVNMPSDMVFNDGGKREVLVQGIIDLLIVDENTKTAKIVDYKYSVKSAEELAKTYKKQLDLYAYAVEKVLMLKVTGKTVISLLSGESVKID